MFPKLKYLSHDERTDERAKKNDTKKKRKIGANNTMNFYTAIAS